MRRASSGRAWPTEERGWQLADAAIPILYGAWTLWLVGLGVSLLV